MGLMKRLRALDQRFGFARRDDESRRDYLERCARWGGHVPPELYREVLDLHERVLALEVALGRQDRVDG